MRLSGNWPGWPELGHNDSGDSVVVGQGGQTFGIEDSFALKEINMVVPQHAQSYEPGSAAVFELRPEMPLVVVFKDDHGRLALGQRAQLRKQFVNCLLCRNGGLHQLAGITVQRLDDESRTVGLMKRDGGFCGTRSQKQRYDYQRQNTNSIHRFIRKHLPFQRDTTEGLSFGVLICDVQIARQEET